MILSLTTALKFRQGRRRSGMVSFISVISTLSIAVGIAALIIGLSAMNGFERELYHRVLSVMPHGQIYSSEGQIKNWPSLQQKLSRNAEIKSVTPFVNFTGLLENGNQLSPITVQGVDPLLELKSSQLPRYVENDQWQNFAAGQNQIIIGSGLAQHLAASEGSWVTLIIPVASDNHKLKSPKRIRLQVKGILNLSGSLSNNLALIPLLDAQQLLQLSDSVTGLMINVHKVYEAENIIYEASKALDPSLTAISWEQSYGYVYHDIQMIRQIMYLAMVVVIGVASFNIVSTLVIAVKDKQRDIAILKTLGAPNRLVRYIFIWYGLISGFVGSMIGVGLGLVLSFNLSAIINAIELLFHHKLLNTNIYFIDFVPSEVHFGDVLIVFITALLLSLLASYYPANKACKIDPAKVLNSF